MLGGQIRSSNQRSARSLGTGIFSLATGTAAAQAIGLVTLPVVTRLYTPAEVGVISLLVAYTSFASRVGTLRFESALMIGKDSSEVSHLFLLGIGASLLSAVISALLLEAMRTNAIMGFGVVPDWTVRWVWFLIAGAGLYLVARSLAVREADFTRVAMATLSRGLAQAGGRVGLGFGPGGVLSLFLAEAVAGWLAFAMVLDRTRLSLGRVSSRRFVRAVRRFWKFPVIETSSVGLDMLAVTFPLPMITALHGPGIAGLYAVAHRVVAVPNAQVGFAIADVFQMRFSELIRDGDPQGARDLYWSALRRLAIFGLVPMFVVILLAPVVAGALLGPDWAVAGTIAAIIAPWLYASLVVNGISRLLSALQRPELKLFYDVSAVLLISAAFLLARARSFSVTETVLAISGANLIAYLVYLGVLMVAISRLNEQVPPCAAS